MAFLSVDEALAKLLSGTGTLAAETVPLHQAGGRALASPVIAKRTQPPFAASAMDGYAVRACDTQSAPVRLQLIGEAAAGHGFSGQIGPGQAVRIFTGAPLPDTADTVIIQEKTRRISNAAVEIAAATTPGQNIRLAGGDFKQGETVLPRGQVMTPAALALAAASGYPVLDVIRRPRIALLSTGDELVLPGDLPGANEIFASSAYGIGETARLHGAQVLDLGIARDDYRAICGAVDAAISQNADILVTCGGVSVGEHDLVQDALKQAGMTLTFWKIAMRPGKPLLSGLLPANPPLRVLGLPGNPASSLVTAWLFLAPLIEKMSGRSYAPRIMTARLASALAANGPRRHYIRAVATRSHATADAKGTDITVRPLANQDSSLLAVMARANCLIVHEAGALEQAGGSLCRIMLPEPLQLI